MVAAIYPYGWWPLIFVGLIPMVFAQYRLISRYWCWIPVSVTALIYMYFSYSRLLSGHAGAWTLYAPLIAAVVVAPLAIIDRRLSERWHFRWFVLQMPVFWTALDAVRQNFPLSGTTGSPAYALAHEPKLIEPISVFGFLGLELLILVINYALALLVLHVLPIQRTVSLVPARKVVAWVLSAVVVASVVWGVSGIMLYNSVQSSSGATMRVAAIQPGIGYQNATEDMLPIAEQEAQFEAQLSSMTKLAAARGAKLVVWPEKYLPFNPATGPARDRVWLRGLLLETHVYVVTGFVGPLSSGAEDWDSYSYKNQAALVAPNGTVIGIYTKQHQAPFDYDTFTVGTASPSFKTGIGTIGMEVCWDAAFQDPSRFSTLGGAAIMTVPSWQYPEAARGQRYDELVFNAVEDRVPTIGADQAWESVIVKADGQIVAASDNWSANGQTGLLVGDVQLGPRISPFLTLGNWVGELSIYGAVALVICCICYMVTDRRKARPRVAGSETDGDA